MVTQKRKHCIYTPFPKDRNCDVCQRTKITRVPCRRRHGGQSASRKVWWLDNSGSQSPQRRKWIPEQSSRRNGYNLIRVKPKLHRRRRRKSSRKFLESSQKPKVIYTNNSLAFGEPCEELAWNYRTSTPHRSETNGIAERAVRRVKEGTSAVLLKSGLDEKWISWNAILIWEMSKTSRQRAKLLVNEDLENHSKDQLFHSVHW